MKEWPGNVTGNLRNSPRRVGLAGLTSPYEDEDGTKAAGSDAMFPPENAAKNDASIGLIIHWVGVGVGRIHGELR